MLNLHSQTTYCMQGSYYEAACTSIDTQKRMIQACFPSHAGLEKHCFQLPYDILIHCPGSCNNTFGISVSHP